MNFTQNVKEEDQTEKTENRKKKLRIKNGWRNNEVFVKVCFYIKSCCC